MTRKEFETLDIGDEVLIGGNSKFKGQTATVVNSQSAMYQGRIVIVRNKLIHERFHFKILKKTGNRADPAQDQIIATRKAIRDIQKRLAFIKVEEDFLTEQLTELNTCEQTLLLKVKGE